MHCTVDGREVACERLGYREMNFGQPAPTLPTTRYRVSLQLSDFVERASAWYEDFVRDDDSVGDDSDSEVVRKLRASEWPPLVDLATLYPKLLAFSSSKVWTTTFGHSCSHAGNRIS